jgi:hypothetical protein
MKAVFLATLLLLFKNAMPCQYLLHHADIVKKVLPHSVNENSSKISQSDVQEDCFVFIVSKIRSRGYYCIAI